MALTAGRPSQSNQSKNLADLAEKKATVRVNFDLDREKHIELKVLAVKSGKSIAELLKGLIDRELEEASLK